MNGAKKAMSICGIVSGGLSIIFSVLLACNYSLGSTASRESYGGDAYTGIQNAAAQTANNIYKNTEILATGLSMILFILGLALIFYFGCKLAERRDTHSYTPPSTRYSSYEYTYPSYAPPASTPTTYPLAGKGAVSEEGWICTKCSSRNPSSKMFCKDCGSTR
ncbi:MAG: hypothetical protein IKB50_01340 [Clostridia bacterium]|nr:hypothetical protein [Clostridia bacterium]